MSFIAELPNLEVLGLWGNNFTGGIPQNLGRNGRLLNLDLSLNKFTGPLPPDLCAGAIVKFRALLNTKSSRELTEFQRLHFTCEDVLACLKEDNIIGKGGSGVVYKGLMPKGEEVAVKRLPAIGKGSFYDHGFSAEIQTLGKIRHRHIVKFLGFCSNQQANLLVYEYMHNGSLGDLLHGTKGEHLQWDTRYKIAIDAAKGLCYLHHDCCPRILHRDVKSNNILPNSNFEAHVADFELAKFLKYLGENSQCMSLVAGAYGYIAPGSPLCLWIK